MTAVTTNRNTPQVSDRPIQDFLYIPVAASTNIPAGALVALDASGRAVNATASLAGPVVGRCFKQADNSGTGTIAGAGTGAAGNISATVQQGVFVWNSGTAADAITNANAGQACYVIDNQTVGLTDANGTRPFAGIIQPVDPNTVFSAGTIAVETRLQLLPPGGVAYPKFALSFAVPALSALANSQVLARFTPGFAGRIVGISFAVATAVTTGSKAANVSAGIGAAGAAYGAVVQTTGGVLGLTSANCTPIGAAVYGSAITAANTFTAAQEVSLCVSGVTAFVEGAGTVIVTFG